MSSSRLSIRGSMWLSNAFHLRGICMRLLYVFCDTVCKAVLASIAVAGVAYLVSPSSIRAILSNEVSLYIVFAGVWCFVVRNTISTPASGYDTSSYNPLNED